MRSKPFILPAIAFLFIALFSMQEIQAQSKWEKKLMGSWYKRGERTSMGANPVRSSDKRLYREFHFRNYGNCQEYVKKLNKTDDLKWKVSWDKAELGKLKQAYSMDYSGKFKPKAIVELSLGKEYSRKLIVHKVGPKWLEIYLVRGKSIYGIEVYEKVDMLIGVPPGGGKATY